MNKEELEVLNDLDIKLELEKEGHVLTYDETYAIARLISEYDDLQDEVQQLKDRIDKAIKYIEHYTEYYKVDGKDYLKAARNYGLEDYQITELLKILKEDYEIN